MPIVFERSPEIEATSQEVDLGLEFYQQTANHRKLSSDVFFAVAEKNKNRNWNEGLARHYKSYQFAERVALTNNFLTMHEKSFREVIAGRRSCRRFDKSAVSIDELSQILQLAYGSTTDESGRQKRTAPSAGACYPIEIYVSAVNVTGLAAGLYHYNTHDHVLEKIRAGDLRDDLINIYENDSSSINDCSFVLTLTGVYERTVTQKYKARGWRSLFFDAGHVGQNIGLAVEATGLAGYLISSGWDNEIPQYLGLSRRDELYMLGFVVGKAQS